MTITTVIIISVFSTLFTITLLGFAALASWRRRRHNKPRCYGQAHSTSGPLELMEEILQLSPEQRAVWMPLKKEIIARKQELAEYREILADAGNMEQAVNRLEDFINDSLIVLRKLKPKLTDFYHSLSSPQQHKVNMLLKGKASENRYCGLRRGTT